MVAGSETPGRFDSCPPQWMKGTSMSEPETEIVQVKAKPSEENHPLAVVERPISLTGGVSLLPVEQQAPLLDEYDKRRQFFLNWVLEHLIEGVHYGIPPGCKLRPNRDGSAVDPKQWKQHPSLYKAGAMLLADLLRLKPVFSTDNETWEQLGKPSGMLCIRCAILNPSTGEALGEGRGCYAVGEKQGAVANSAVKLAEKRAMVDAMLNSVPLLSEMFTQDIEEGGAMGSAARQEAADVKPRGERQPQPQTRTAPQALRDEVAAAIADWFHKPIAQVKRPEIAKAVVPLMVRVTHKTAAELTGPGAEAFWTEKACAEAHDLLEAEGPAALGLVEVENGNGADT